MNESRDRILSRIPSSGSERPEPVVHSKFISTDLWADFERYFDALGGRIISEDELLTSLLARKTFYEEAAAEILHHKVTDVDPWEAEVGVSVADLAIAEMGSLIVSAGPGRSRESSLVTPINVMLIRGSEIVATLAEAIPRISSRSSAVITGPSRTADIEGILVRGIHGPAELLLYVYD